MNKELLIGKIEEAINLLDGVSVPVHNNRKLIVVAVEDLLEVLQELRKPEEKKDGKPAEDK